MSKTESIKELERALSHSRALLPAHFAFLAFMVIVCLLLSFFYSPPWWLQVVLLGAGSFALIGDVVNVFYCRRKLRALQKDQR